MTANHNDRVHVIKTVRGELWKMHITESVLGQLYFLSGLTLRSPVRVWTEVLIMSSLGDKIWNITEKSGGKHKGYSVIHIILFSLNPTLMASDRKAAPVICQTQTCVFLMHGTKCLHIISPIFTLFLGRQHLREWYFFSMIFFFLVAVFI